MSGGNFFKLLPDNSEATAVSQISDNGTISFALNRNGQVRDLFLSDYNAFSSIQKSDTADAIYLLYETVLDRKPDAAGFSAWINAVDQVGLRSIASNFVGSAEFRASTTSLSDADFIRTLYAQALGRDTEAQAIEAWSTFLAQGSSRADLALEIVQSQEMARVTGIATIRDYGLVV